MCGGDDLLFNSSMIPNGSSLNEISTDCQQYDSVMHDKGGAEEGAVERRVWSERLVR